MIGVPSLLSEQWFTEKNWYYDECLINVHLSGPSFDPVFVLYSVQHLVQPLFLFLSSHPISYFHSLHYLTACFLSRLLMLVSPPPQALRFTALLTLPWVTPLFLVLPPGSVCSSSLCLSSSAELAGYTDDDSVHCLSASDSLKSVDI